MYIVKTPPNIKGIYLCIVNIFRHTHKHIIILFIFCDSVHYIYVIYDWEIMETPVIELLNKYKWEQLCWCMHCIFCFI